MPNQYPADSLVVLNDITEEVVIPKVEPQSVVLTLYDVATIGPAGATGPAGIQGPPGPTGIAGSPGNPGPPLKPRGTVANAAALPPTGNAQGDMFVTADTGHAWVWNGTSWIDQGPFTGPPGPTGAGGPAATCNAGTTVTTAPGTSATVTNVGTTSAAVFNFGIPQGALGNTGATGPPGTTGAPGSAAWTLTTANFTVPAVGSTVVINVNDTTWATIGEMLYIATAGAAAGAGLLQITAKTSTTLTLLNPTSSPGVPLADATQDGLLKKVSGNTTDFVDGTNACQNLVTAIQPTIWSARLRSYNAVGNPNFEIDQRFIYAANNWAVTGWTSGCDRWNFFKTAGITATGTTQAVTAIVPVPNTSFLLSRGALRIGLTAQQASIPGSDAVYCVQQMEGQQIRELYSDVSSLSVLCRISANAPFSFGVSLRDAATSTKSWTGLCTISTNNVWTLCTFPNIPVFPSANFSYMPGVMGAQLALCFAAGPSNINASNGVWNSVNTIGAVGQGNFCNLPVNTFLDIAMVQWEPGPVCTVLQDLDFQTNLSRCQRYFSTSYPAGYKPGSVTAANATGWLNSSTNMAQLIGYISFPTRMAKTPTMSIYSPNTGAVNSIRDNTSGVDLSLASPFSWGAGDAAFNGVNLSAVLGATGKNLQLQWVADSGW